MATPTSGNINENPVFTQNKTGSRTKDDDRRDVVDEKTSKCVAEFRCACSKVAPSYACVCFFFPFPLRFFFLSFSFAFVLPFRSVCVCVCFCCVFHFRSFFAFWTFSILLSCYFIWWEFESENFYYSAIKMKFEEWSVTGGKNCHVWDDQKIFETRKGFWDSTYVGFFRGFLRLHL